MVGRLGAMTEEEFDIMAVPGLISPDERELLREASVIVAHEFGPDVVLVNIGVFHGGSSYCMRAGAPKATLYGVELGDLDVIEGDREILDMIILHGDSRELWKDFQSPIHSIFVDGGHSYDIVKSDIQHWVLPYVVPGGYVLCHDAYYDAEDRFYEDHQGVERAVEELLAYDTDWEEQGLVDTTRWFKRLA